MKWFRGLTTVTSYKSVLIPFNVLKEPNPLPRISNLDFDGDILDMMVGNQTNYSNLLNFCIKRNDRKERTTNKKREGIQAFPFILIGTMFPGYFNSISFFVAVKFPALIW